MFNGPRLATAALLLAGLAPCHAEERETLPASAFDRNAVDSTEALPGFGEGEAYWRRNFFKRFWGDQGYLFTTWIPAEGTRFRFTLPLTAATVFASGAASGGSDLRWSNSIEAWAADGRGGVFRGLSSLGEGKTAAALIGSTYLISRWSGNDRMAKTASLSGEALLNAGIYNVLLKKLARRARPYGDGRGEFFVSRPGGDQSNTSFPSGHAMGAFAVAAVVAGEYGEKRWVVWVAYGAAGAVALSRVALGAHFISDVVAGGLLGDSFGRMVTHRSDGELPRATWRRFTPTYDPGRRGVGVSFRHSW